MAEHWQPETRKGRTHAMSSLAPFPDAMHKLMVARSQPAKSQPARSQPAVLPRKAPACRKPVCKSSRMMMLFETDGVWGIWNKATGTVMVYRHEDGLQCPIPGYCMHQSASTVPTFHG